MHFCRALSAVIPAAIAVLLLAIAGAIFAGRSSGAADGSAMPDPTAQAAATAATAVAQAEATLNGSVGSSRNRLLRPAVPDLIPAVRQRRRARCRNQQRGRRERKRRCQLRGPSVALCSAICRQLRHCGAAFALRRRCQPEIQLWRNPFASCGWRRQLPYITTDPEHYACRIAAGTRRRH